ncbi:toll/interleukin-1 receptor (TIR) domain-containing protein [Artemisia annua]|uniref:Toll/interleukin-1 receptor (TIR) domain-containing protein n=1 Tax=Artemisia annua TaxID=35608 RepID=A0A2U1NX21_ARTAN|nr:toll/interleukin-1 receptor (TIR) domain-containing protein [Artemisia annua]
MEMRIDEVLTSLEIGTEDVHMIGIWGMGGGGKTTLARAVFDRISIHFDGKAFVENVREVSESSLYGLNKLQQVLSSVLSKENITVSSVHEGTNMMKKMMRGRKVLIVLDNVDDTKQLEVLAGEPNWFKLGSRVIITTRDKQVLLAHRVKFINDVNLLSHAEAISLFSKYAFAREIPNQRYEELSRQVVKYADGLPLTIKVLGSMLYGQNEPQWTDTLERLKKIPLKATMEKLELSYNGLEEDYKELFLDVACLLKGWYKKDAIRSLESCGFFAEAGLRILELKSLITISKYGKLCMHDHIEEMGMNIVRRLNPNEPNKHSRLWIEEEIEEILANDSGTQSTKCITLNASLDLEILMKGLANMKELRLLDLHTTSPRVSEDASNGRIWNFDEIVILPNALRFLRWDGYPFSSLPKTFQANNIVGLEMEDSNIIQLWDDGEEKACLKLRFLKFINTNLRTLDLSVAPNLETLFLEKCYSLEKLHMPAECPKLVNLDLSNSKLRTLHLGITPNLERLSLYKCTDMVELHMPYECPKLVNLDLHKLKLRTLHLGIAPNLETLSLYKCTDMVELCMPSDCLKLVNLDLSNLNLRTLDLSAAPNIETLLLQSCYNLVEVYFQVTPNLKELRVHGCCRLEKLHMPAESPKLRSLELNDSELRALQLGITPNLETLNVNDCPDMVELRMPAECPKLVILNLGNLKLMTLPLGITPNLKRLSLYNCTDMVELHMPYECPKLVNLDLINLKLMTLRLRITSSFEMLSL